MSNWNVSRHVGPNHPTVRSKLIDSLLTTLVSTQTVRHLKEHRHRTLKQARRILGTPPIPLNNNSSSSNTNPQAEIIVTMARAMDKSLLGIRTQAQPTNTVNITESELDRWLDIATSGLDSNDADTIVVPHPTLPSYSLFDTLPVDRSSSKRNGSGDFVPRLTSLTCSEEREQTTTCFGSRRGSIGIRLRIHRTTRVL
jgi:hypothetical protein